MSNITSCDSGSFSTENTGEDTTKKQSGILAQFHSSNSHASIITNNSNGSNSNSQSAPPAKKKRSLPGNPDPSAEVIALSPNTLVTKNRFICEICNKGFQRDQNLQLHRRGHSLPWKLKQRSNTEVRKRVYVCPEPLCVHHNPARALGDLPGIKKHFSRKHGEKKWKCDKCSKKYALQSDLQAHSKVCGTKEYKCDYCGTIFSRRDSFITHRAFCDALAEENNKVNEVQSSKLLGNTNLQGQVPIPSLVVPPLPINTNSHNNPSQLHQLSSSLPQDLIPKMPTATKPFNMLNSSDPSLQLSSNSTNMLQENGHHNLTVTSPHMSATALLQKAAQMGATMTEKSYVATMEPPSFGAAQMSQYMHISSQYNFNNKVNGMNGHVDMFNATFDQSQAQALSKILEQNNTRSSDINIIGQSKRSEDVMTLDLLGIGGGGNENFYSGAQQSETAATDEVWRNWSTENASSFESFSATSSM